MEHDNERVTDATNQLDFGMGSSPGATPDRTGRAVSPTRGARVRGPKRLCVVCGRSVARLTLARSRGQAPVRLCLRCHHGVMQQRKMLRAGLSFPAAGSAASHEGVRSNAGQLGRQHHMAGQAGLIVPRASDLFGEAKYDTLTRHRRRAQVAARRALESDSTSTSTERRLASLRPDLLDRAS